VDSVRKVDEGGFAISGWAVLSRPECRPADRIFFARRHGEAVVPFAELRTWRNERPDVAVHFASENVLMAGWHAKILTDEDVLVLAFDDWNASIAVIGEVRR
jgi:hypothetical protein